MTRAKLFTPVNFILALLAILLIALLLPKQQNNQQRKNKVIPVKIAIVRQQPFKDSIEALGTAQANEAVTITTHVSEKVANIHFDDGEFVQQGQLLVSLNNQEELAKLKELEVKLAEEKRQLTRLKSLKREAATSEQLLDEQQARVKSFHAQLDVAKAKLEDLSIKAPFAGLLGIRNISPGSLIRPGDQITTLDDVDIMKVDFSIPEVFLPDLAIGQQIEARSIAYKNSIFTGEISSIDSRVDPITRAIRVRAKVSNKNHLLRQGMLLQILLTKQLDNVILIPESSLIPIQDRQYVFIVDEQNIARKKQVILGRRQSGQGEIVSGLTVGDKIVMEGALRLSPDSPVKILEE